MVSTSRRRKGGGAWSVGILAGLSLIGASCGKPDADLEPVVRGLDKMVEDRGGYLIYVPADLPAGKLAPLVFALSPSADAASMIRTWRVIAERHGWIVAASKQFKNGIEYEIVLSTILQRLDEIEGAYPVDKSRIILTGLSGGAMAAHAFAGFHADRVRAVVANTGMMEESFMVSDYPKSRLAVFLASPGDFRFREMKRDQAFLQSQGWTTAWIEFDGGHAMAPPAVYEKAATWLEGHW